jgi:hypothetical protein
MQPHDFRAFKIRISLFQFLENGCMQQGNKLKQETNSSITKTPQNPYMQPLPISKANSNS